MRCDCKSDVMLTCTRCTALDVAKFSEHYMRWRTRKLRFDVRVGCRCRCCASSSSSSSNTIRSRFLPSHVSGRAAESRMRRNAQRTKYEFYERMKAKASNDDDDDDDLCRCWW
uniref:Uncharacterized protein n=1 Tax=Lotharella globosa TaxID=91324 RepID=A0A7S3YWC4_9EUKA